MTSQSFDVYVYNPQLDLIGMIEGGRNQSFIWTDRYASSGDFKFVGPAGRKNLDLLQPGNLISIDQSPTLMMIESHLNETAREQGAKLTIAGSSIDTFLKYRYIPSGHVLSKRTVKSHVYNTISRVCLLGDPKDNFPNLTVPGSGDGIEADVEYTVGSTLYDTVWQLCNSVDYGFKLSFSNTTLNLHAQVYEGQTLDDVIFTPAMNTLANMSYLNSVQSYYNAAFVRGKNHTFTYGIGASYSGFERRMLYVNASDVETTEENYVEKLSQKAREALTDHKRTSVFDGDIDPDSVYQYGRDYNLGDIIKIQDNWGNDAQARVSEFIWSYDSSGVQSYPSFTAVN